MIEYKSYKLRLFEINIHGRDLGSCCTSLSNLSVSSSRSRNWRVISASTVQRQGENSSSPLRNLFREDLSREEHLRVSIPHRSLPFSRAITIKIVDFVPANVKRPLNIDAPLRYLPFGYHADTEKSARYYHSRASAGHHDSLYRPYSSGDRHSFLLLTWRVIINDFVIRYVNVQFRFYLYYR